MRSLLDAAAEAGASGGRLTQGIVLHEALRIGAQPRDVLAGLEAVVRDRRAAEPRDVARARTRARRRRRRRARVGVGGVRTGRVPVVGGRGRSRGGGRVPNAAAWRCASERARGAATRLLAACRGATTPALANLLPVPALTRRELEVSRLAAGGLSNSSIADRLGVGVRTVEGHLLRAMTKLGVRSRADLGPALGEPEPA